MIPEGIQPYFVLGLVFVMFLLIYREILKPSISFLLGVILLIITGILDTDLVLAGFANEKIITILILVLITAGIKKNFQIESLFDLIFKASKTYRGFLIRMMSQTALLSSVINNTPVVALMTPYVIDWGKSNKISPSKLLIPLSFATIMGGMITMIGTSTTLFINGFLEDYNHPVMNAYDLLIIGFSVTATGIFFIAFFGQKLLPERKDLLKDYAENIKEYVVETRLSPKSKLIGKNLIEAGLRNLKGVYLVEIIRNNRTISPVEPQEVIEDDDILIFAGNTNDIFDLVNKEAGIMLPSTARDLDSDRVQAVEVVINPNSTVVGKTVKQGEFRNRYDAAIIAVNRNGERVGGKIGDIVLQAGDLLLLYTGSDFRNRADLYRDIHIISQIKRINKPGNKKYYALGTIILSIIFFLIFGEKIALVPALMIIISIMVGFGLLKTYDVKRELDLNMVIILVFSLAIGKAIEITGAGAIMANLIIEVLHPMGSVALLAGIMFLANILTSTVGNAGAVSIVFPIAYEMSKNLEINGAPYFLALAYAASAAFMTPISYQTNLIVYGPGGYTFKDFLKIGLPVNVIYLTVSLAAILYLYRDILL